MLNWYFENSKWLGFDDDTLVYIVDYNAEEGWRWLDVFEGWGIHGYESAEEAKADAEAEFEKFPNKVEFDEPFYTLEEIEILLAGE